MFYGALMHLFDLCVNPGNMVSGGQDSGLRTQNSGLRIQKPEYGVRGAGLRTQNSETRIWWPGGRTQDSGL
jgi:hypothetical protein